ncbi:hypothetical protein STEG23_015790 [Scotinomys teguina]
MPTNSKLQSGSNSQTASLSTNTQHEQSQLQSGSNSQQLVSQLQSQSLYSILCYNTQHEQSQLQSGSSQQLASPKAATTLSLMNKANFSLVPTVNRLHQATLSYATTLTAYMLLSMNKANFSLVPTVNS